MPVYYCRREQRARGAAAALIAQSFAYLDPSWAVRIGRHYAGLPALADVTESEPDDTITCRRGSAA